MNKRGYLLWLVAGWLAGCTPETPPTSVLTVGREAPAVAVEKQLYGLAMGNAGQALDGGLYAELIRNRSFDDGLTDGWHPLSSYSYLATDEKRPVNETDRHSLLIGVSATPTSGRGGVWTEGYQGIPLRKGENYQLSFYLRTATSVTPRTLRVALEDSVSHEPLSRAADIQPTYEWTHIRQTLTALEDAGNAVLTFSSDSTTYFFLDQISLLPEKTWNGNSGLRPDLMEKIRELHPAFLRFPEGAQEEEAASRKLAGMSRGLGAEAVFTVGEADDEGHPWADTSFCAGEAFFIACPGLFDAPYNPYTSGLFVNGFSLADRRLAGTMRAAVAEACFLVNAERRPDRIRRVAYAPVLGDAAGRTDGQSPLITFARTQIVCPPSYYMYRMFAANRGDEVLKTETDTYWKPQVTFGGMSIRTTGERNEITDIRIGGRTVAGELPLAGNAGRYAAWGDSTWLNYDVSLRMKQGDGEGPVFLYVRDNGRRDDGSDYICLRIDGGRSRLYHRTGRQQVVLSESDSAVVRPEQAFGVSVRCLDDTVSCYINNVLVHHVALAPLPSLVSAATYDREQGCILLKVVNTTWHEEKTLIRFPDLSVSHKDVQRTQLRGLADDRNTFDRPQRIVPTEETLSFPSGAIIYHFPPNSITILRFKANE